MVDPGDISRGGKAGWVDPGGFFRGGRAGCVDPGRGNRGGRGGVDPGEVTRGEMGDERTEGSGAEIFGKAARDRTFLQKPVMSPAFARTDHRFKGGDLTRLL